LVGPYGRQARRDIGRYPYPAFVPELSIDDKCAPLLLFFFFVNNLIPSEK
jgi:hypothetical protein